MKCSLKLSIDAEITHHWLYDSTNSRPYRYYTDNFIEVSNSPALL